MTVGYIDSNDADYDTARNGGGTVTVNTGNTGYVGQGDGFTCYESFIEIDTSAVAAAPDAALLRLHCIANVYPTPNEIRVVPYDYGASLDAGDWRTPAQLSAGYTGSGISTALIVDDEWFTINLDPGFINVGGMTRLVLYTWDQEDGDPPDPFTADNIIFDTGGAEGPQLLLGKAAASEAGDYDDEVGADGPLLWWKMNEETGSLVLVDYGYDGANHGVWAGTGPSPTLEQTPLTLDGLSASLANTDTDVIVAEGPVLAGIFSEISMEAWVRFDDLRESWGYSEVCGFDQYDPNIYFSIAIYGTPMAFEGYIVGDPGGGADANCEGPAVAIDTTYHVALVYNGTDLRMYVNGVLVDTDASLPGLTFTPSDQGLRFRAGGDGYGYGSNGGSPGDGVTGKIDNVAVYDYALSAARVLAHYEAGTTPPGPAAPTVDADPTPLSGPETGGTEVIITGADFTDATSVQFGATEAASFTVDSDSQITAVTPPHAPGEVDISVTTPAGTGSG